MAQIIKFPAPASKFGHRRVKRRAPAPEHPDQLPLFHAPGAKILDILSGLSPFEQALTLDERGDARAEEHYRRAIAEQDCPADAYCNLGILQSKRGDAIKAFDSFTAALTHNPRHFEAHYNLGNMYFDVNDHRLAQVHYQIAAEIEPSFANVYFNLALVQALANDFAAAIHALLTYQSLAPDREARHADELLENLKKSLAAVKNAGSGSAG